MVYRKMLIAIDGSEPSIHALKESLRLADREKSCLTAICVTPFRENINRAGYVSEQMSIPCEAIERARVIASDNNINIRFVHETGIIHEQILNAAKEYDCDLIIMGRHKIHGLEQILTGSVTANILSISHCDVLIVPHESSIGWSNILVATDGSIYSHGALERALYFASAYKGHLHVVSVVDMLHEPDEAIPVFIHKMVNDAKSYVDEALQMSSSIGVQCRGHVRIGQPASIILELIDEFYIKNIFISSHGKTGYESSMFGSVAGKIIGLSPCPVFIGRS